MASYSLKCNLQEKFLKNLKEKIDNENGVDVCLWQLSYSYMKLILCYTNKHLINEKKILDFIKEEMKLETIQKLIVNFDFKNQINIDYLDSENEIRFIFEHKRNKSHPHGKVKIFCSGG